MSNKIDSQQTAVEHAKVLEKVFQLVNDQLIGQLTSLLEAAPDRINSMADKCGSHAEQERLFALYRFIKTENINIQREFFVALNNKIRPNAAAPDSSDSSTDDELSLVSQDEMEEMVALTTMHAHAMNLYGEQVDHLEARLEYIEIASSLSLDKECLNPIRLAEAFQETLKAFTTLDLQDKIELYKLFENEVMLKLGNMYSAINELLILAGIMPTIMLKTSRQIEIDDDEEITIKQVRTKAADDHNETGVGNIKTFPAQPTPQNLRQIASQVMSGEYVAPQHAVNLPASFRKPVCKKELNGDKFYDRKEVVKALSRLQNKIINGEYEQQPASTEQIKRELYTDMGEQEGGVATRQVNVLDERSIDFVGMMFDAITEDETISVVIKNLLLRLQIPVIKVAMSDSHLFEKDNHPTRVVLDLITEGGKGVTEEHDRMFGKLENVVDNILKEYDVDIETFTRAANYLRDLIDEETRATAQAEQQAQRQIIYHNAREVIVDEVRHITARKKVPSNVVPLVTRNWPSLMINRYVKHGKESWQWLESVMLMKLMIKCLQPIQSSQQWQTVWRNHLALVEAVHDELSTTKQKRNLIEEQTEKLKDAFIDLLDAYGYKLVEEARVTSATMFEDADSDKDIDIAATRLHQAANDPMHNEEDDRELRKTHIAEVAELAKAKINRLPSNVHPGVWFELYNGEDRIVRRLKLSVVLTEVAKLVFVDRKGVKVMEKDAADFAAELEANKSRFIADHSTFEHALGKVIGALAA